MATKTFTAKTKGEWVQLSTLINFDFVDGKDYTLQVLGTAKFGDDGKTGILIDSTTPYTYTHKSGVDLYVMTENEDGAVITVSDSASLALATRGGGSGGGSGDAVWGSITGTLSDQTDLANALANKQDTLTAGAGISISDNVISATGGSVSFDDATINENASNELQAIGVKEARTDTAIRFWHGSQAEYNNGESQTYYNWTHSNGSAVEGNWTNVTLPASANWTSVCYGNGKYVAVASGSTTAIYSTNGTSWNSATLPASANWSSVCYGNGRFVAVANGSASAAYSTDGGETWIEATMPAGRRWRGVCYGNGKFIAVGNGGYYATSTDGGETWTEAQFTTGESGTYYSVCYGNGKFVAIKNESSVSKVSADGENWTNITLPGNRMLWASVAFGAKGFVAVANYYKVGAYSADGETWEEVTLSDTINQWTSVCYGNGKFVAVSESTDKVAVSTDGKNWSEETVAAASKAFDTITYGGGKFVTLVTGSTEEYYKDSTAASDSVYTTDATPTTASTVYYSTTIIADLTITAVASGTITLSDGNTYTYDSTGDQTVTYSVGELHPNYICFIDGVGVKIGTATIATATTVSQTYDATSTDAISGVGVAQALVRP